jgi:hypothetical protein
MTDVQSSPTCVHSGPVRAEAERRPVELPGQGPGGSCGPYSSGSGFYGGVFKIGCGKRRLERVREGAEIVIVQNQRPVAVIRTPPGPGRSLDEAIALAEAFEANPGYAPVPDPDFARDVQEAIDAHRKPMGLPSWD